MSRVSDARQAGAARRLSCASFAAPQMKIHEYQASSSSRGTACRSRRAIRRSPSTRPRRPPSSSSTETGSPVVVVKAQIHAGGRGKGGGVKVAKGGAAEARELAQKILGMQLVTHQTGPEGQKVRRLYIEQGLDIARELYLGAVDRPRPPARRVHGVDRGRHGDREGRGRDAREDPHGARRPDRRASRPTRRASSRSASGLGSARRRSASS